MSPAQMVNATSAVHNGNAWCENDAPKHLSEGLK